jgi:hypothetical protein
MWYHKALTVKGEELSRSEWNLVHQVGLYSDNGSFIDLLNLRIAEEAAPVKMYLV